MHLQFNEWDGAPQIPVNPSPATIIELIPLSSLTHEFVHFVQTTTTAAGLREFAFSLDLLHSRASLISAAASASDGVLRAPLIAHAGDYSSSTPFLQALRTALLLTRACVIYLGGARYPSSRLSSPIAMNDEQQSWLRLEVAFKVFGKQLDSPLPFADLSLITGDHVAVALGAVHLEESCAKTVERVQRLLHGEAGDTAHFGPHVQPSTAEHTALADPYFVASWMFGNISRHLGAAGNAEEYFCIADLALLIDALTLNKAGIEIPELHIQRTNDLHIEDNPFLNYMGLLSVFGEHWRDLPRVQSDWRQRDVVSFQNALLKAAGASCSVKDLTQTVMDQCEAMINAWTGRTLFSDDLMRAYGDTFVTMLTWRRDTLDGGAVLMDYYTSSSELRRFVLDVVPAVAIGGLVVSPRGGFRAGEGVGVDIANLLQVRDLIDAIVYGNRPCPLHTSTPRCCVVPIHSLCTAIPSATPTHSRCAREQIAQGVLEGLGVKELRWAPV